MSPASDPRSFQPLKTNELLILMAVAAGPLHGYGIMRDVEVRTDGEVVLHTGAMYRTLRRLLKSGLIEECGRPEGETSRDERRRYYQPSTLGRGVLEAEIERMSKLVRAGRMAADGRRGRLA